jgi:hypothetical protein
MFKDVLRKPVAHDSILRSQRAMLRFYTRMGDIFRAAMVDIQH